MFSDTDITLVVPTLCRGGAERVMVNMANWWVEHGKRVSLITFDDNPSAFPLHKAVQRIVLDAIAPQNPHCPEWPEEAIAVNKLCQALQQTGSSPVISFLTKMNLRTLLAGHGLGRKLIVCERAHPPQEPLPPALETLRRTIYPTANKLVVLTLRSAQEWAYAFMPKESVAVIPNPIVAPARPPQAPEGFATLPKPWQAAIEAGRFFLTVGRLEEQKGFDLLLEGTHKAAQVNSSVRVLILGEGTERENLQAQIQHYGLTEQVLLFGQTDSVLWFMQRACGYLLSSRYEGFPNVLLEAVSVNLPFIAFDCATGPREIAQATGLGQLVPCYDVNLFAKQMLCAFATKLERPLPDGQTPYNVPNEYSRPAIMQVWDALLKNNCRR